MKNLILITLITVGLSVSFWSCEKEDELKDLEVPTTDLQLSKNAVKLYNEVTLTSNSSDNGSVAKVVFFVDEQSLGEDFEEPFEISWNTKNVKDGAHILKVIAYDEAGNIGEALVNVNVKNTLLTVKVGNEYSPTNPDGEWAQWIFLSDENGKQVGPLQKIVDGESLTWQRPSDFESPTFYLNRIGYSLINVEVWEKPHKTMTFETYPDFTVDEFLLSVDRSPKKQREVLGKVDINVVNDFEGSKDYIYRTSQSGSSARITTAENDVSYSLDMYEANSSAYSTYELDWDGEVMDEREKYYRRDDLTVGNAYEFHASEYTAMDSRTMTVPFQFDNLYVSVHGFPSPEGNSLTLVDGVYLYDNKHDKVKIFYSDFPVEQTYIDVRLGDKFFSSIKDGKAPEVFNLPEFSALVTKEGSNTIQVNPSGDFDYGWAIWGKSLEDENATGSYDRTIYFKGKAEASYAIPDLPAQLLELYPWLNDELAYRRTSMYDFQHLSSYDDILEDIFNDAFKGTKYREGVFVSISSGK